MFVILEDLLEEGIHLFLGPGLSWFELLPFDEAASARARAPPPATERKAAPDTLDLATELPKY